MSTDMQQQNPNNTPAINDGAMPDDCSSLNGCQGGGHCKQCSHALYTGEVTARGRRWPFEFNPRFGVIFTRVGDGEPKAVQPSEKHPVWNAWEEWHKAKFGTV